MWRLLARNSHGRWMACWAYDVRDDADRDAKLVKKLHPSWKVETISAPSLALTVLR